MCQEQGVGLHSQTTEAGSHASGKNDRCRQNNGRTWTPLGRTRRISGPAPARAHAPMLGTTWPYAWDARPRARTSTWTASDVTEFRGTRRYARLEYSRELCGPSFPLHGLFHMALFMQAGTSTKRSEAAPRGSPQEDSVAPFAYLLTGLSDAFGLCFGAGEA